MTETWAWAQRVALVAVAASAALVTVGSCDSFFFLRGTLGGDCDAPRVTMTDLGSDTATLRRSNCQATGAVCCRRSFGSTRTSCQYPEDCYVAPYQGPCATPVDCADTQTCDTNGSCQCLLGGPACMSATTHAVTCCGKGQTCDTKTGACSGGPDGGA